MRFARRFAAEECFLAKTHEGWLAKMAVSATFFRPGDAVNADFLAVEGLHRMAAVCHCVYFLDCPDCRVPLCSFSRVFFLLRFLSAIVSGE